MIQEIEVTIDFDRWAQLAVSDPAAFEIARQQVMDAVISQAPVARQQRLRCLQWRIDRVRDLSQTPMAACLQLSRMMWDSVVGPGGLLESFQELGVREGRQIVPKKSAKVAAEVITFPHHFLPKK